MLEREGSIVDRYRKTVSLRGCYTGRFWNEGDCGNAKH